MTIKIGPTVREQFRRERARLWTRHEALAIIEFADAVCLYARGGDWILAPFPMNPHDYVFVRPSYEALEDHCRRILFGDPRIVRIVRRRQFVARILE